MSAFADQNHRTLAVKIEITSDEAKLVEDIKSLVQEMLSLPAEETARLSVSPLTGGITNRLYLVENAIRPDYHVIVRFFGEGTHEFIDRNAENMVFAALSDRRFGPRFEGLFENGRVEGYLHARCISPAEMSQPAVMRQVAHVVHRLHGFHLPQFFAYQRGWHASSPAYRRPSLNSSTNSAHAVVPVSAEHTHANRAEPWVWKKIHLFFSLAIGDVRSLEASSSAEDATRLEIYRQLGLDAMLEETKWLQERVEKILAQLAFHMHYHDYIHGLKAPDGVHDRVSSRDQGMAYALEEVLCHNDLLSGNILVMRENSNKKGGKTEKVDVRLIDYEYAAYNYRSYDVANHFCEFGGFEFDVKNFPSNDVRRAFLKAYLEESRVKEIADEEFIDGFENMVELMVLVSSLFWGTWSVVQAAKSSVDFDYLGYAGRRFEGYFYFKELFDLDL